MCPPENDGPAPARLPERIEDLLAFSVACGCGRTHAVTTRGVALGAGVLDQLVPWAREVGSGLKVAVVVDRVTRGVAGDAVFELLARDGQQSFFCLVPDGQGGRPHADDPGLAMVEQACRGADLAVAVGAGTLNDLAKLSSHRAGIPYLVVPTAPSMNGYTSAIAAIMQAGVKRTIDCHQPLAVIADLDIVATAPMDLVAAGLGDLESKPTATADYRLAGIIRGDYYCAAPESVVLSAEARVAAAAEAIGARDPQALALLMEALLLSGFSMKLAGSSSPASGGEHLISHLWDMRAQQEGREEGLHGAQVGVATLVTAALYERLRQIDPATIDPGAVLARRQDVDGLKADIHAIHGNLADLVEAECLAKRLDDEQQLAEIAFIISHWDALWHSLDPVLRPVERIRDILRAGRAPTRVSELGLTAGHLRQAFLKARQIRSRYTVLDFAASLGLLEPLCDEVLQHSGCLG